MAIDTKSSVKDFTPVLETQLIEFMLTWPVKDFGVVLREIEQRQCYDKDVLFNQLFDTINQNLVGFGVIKNTMVFDDIAITIDTRGAVVDFFSLKQVVAKACRVFWNSKDLCNAKEVIALRGD
jgi:hypothetical protein